MPARSNPPRRVGFRASPADFFAVFVAAAFFVVLPAIVFTPGLLRVASSAAPFDCVRQHEQVQPREEEQGQREKRRVGYPTGRSPARQGNEVGDDRRREGDGRPAVNLTNPEAQLRPPLTKTTLPTLADNRQA